jgi:hypothetical protein
MQKPLYSRYENVRNSFRGLNRMTLPKRLLALALFATIAHPIANTAPNRKRTTLRDVHAAVDLARITALGCSSPECAVFERRLEVLRDQILREIDDDRSYHFIYPPKAK